MQRLPRLELPKTSRELGAPATPSPPLTPHLLSPNTFPGRQRSSSLNALVRTSTDAALQSPTNDTYNFRQILEQSEERRKSGTSGAASIRSGLSATSRKARSFVEGLKDTTGAVVRRLSFRSVQRTGSPVREYSTIKDMARPIGDRLPSDGQAFEAWKPSNTHTGFQTIKKRESANNRVLVVHNPD